jgi:hypothetical protein
VGDTVSFDASASQDGTVTTWSYVTADNACEPNDPADSPITSYHWDFADGTTQVTNTPTTTHAFAAPGSFTVNLTTSTGHKNSTVASQTVGVSKAATTSALASSTNSSSFGDSVTFSVQVATSTASGVPGGTVTFKVDGTSIGDGNMNSSGEASVTTASIEPGSHSVTATYNGDSNHASSNAGPLALTVNKRNTTTSLVSSANPSKAGSSVTFTATVVGSSVGTPSGSVQFVVDGVDAGGPVPLTGGTASYSTSSLAPGSHTVSASYSGDSHYNGDSSSPFTQTVSTTSSGGGGSSGTTGGSGSISGQHASHHHRKHHKRHKHHKHKRH